MVGKFVDEVGKCRKMKNDVRRWGNAIRWIGGVKSLVKAEEICTNLYKNHENYIFWGRVSCISQIKKVTLHVLFGELNEWCQRNDRLFDTTLQR